MAPTDDAEKSTINHTILVHSKQHLHNKIRRPNREHQCGAGQIPSKGQIRISHNSRMPEQGKLCVPQLVRALGLLQQQKVEIFSLVQKSFPYRNPYERILLNPFLVRVFLSVGRMIFPCIDMRGSQVLVVLEPSLSYTPFSSMSSISHLCPMLTPSAWSHRLHTVAMCQWIQGRRVWLERCSMSLYQWAYLRFYPYHSFCLSFFSTLPSQISLSLSLSLSNTKALNVSANPFNQSLNLSKLTLSHYLLKTLSHLLTMSPCTLVAHKLFFIHFSFHFF